MITVVHERHTRYAGGNQEQRARVPDEGGALPADVGLVSCVVTACAVFRGSRHPRKRGRDGDLWCKSFA